jgi:mannose-6-phosphate isomerase-like protein (cupin superfamily)
MPQSRSHFRYTEIEYESVIAHQGSAPILFRRLTDRSLGSMVNFIDASIVPVNSEIGIHTHEPDNEEIYVVLAGRGLMHVDGRDFEVSAGDVIVNRPGGTHGLRNIGEDALRLIVIEVPATRAVEFES